VPDFSAAEKTAGRRPSFLSAVRNDGAGKLRFPPWIADRATETGGYSFSSRLGKIQIAMHRSLFFRRMAIFCPEREGFSSSAPSGRSPR
jgi:hypothetical protein